MLTMFKPISIKPKFQLGLSLAQLSPSLFLLLIKLVFNWKNIYTNSGIVVVRGVGLQSNWVNTLKAETAKVDITELIMSSLALERHNTLCCISNLTLLHTLPGLIGSTKLTKSGKYDLECDPMISSLFYKDSDHSSTELTP